MMTHLQTGPNSDSPVIWPKFNQLLETAQYEHATELLQQAEATSQQTGNDSAAQILAAARQICSVFGQCQAEINWHQQAAVEAHKRAQALSQQLYTMLALVTDEAFQLPQPESSPVEAAQPNKGPTSLKIYALGEFRAYQDGNLITNWSGLKARLIFKYLVAHQGTPVSKDILMDVFWPEAGVEAARRNLHTAIWSLRQTLKQEGSDLQPVQFENDCYFFNPKLDIWLDYVEFEQHVQAGQQFEKAGKLAEAEVEYSIAGGIYQGDFLEKDLFADWPVMQRQYLRSVYLDLTDRLSKYYMQQGRYGAAVTMCHKMLALDNCYEAAYRRLMTCYIAQHRRSAALQQYKTCIKTLKTELDVMPSGETETLYQQIVNMTNHLQQTQSEALLC